MKEILFVWLNQGKWHYKIIFLLSLLSSSSLFIPLSLDKSQTNTDHLKEQALLPNIFRKIILEYGPEIQEICYAEPDTWDGLLTDSQ